MLHQLRPARAEPAGLGRIHRLRTRSRALSRSPRPRRGTAARRDTRARRGGFRAFLRHGAALGAWRPVGEPLA
nr:MAG TPA: hypothetical protein [Caudoviricetes sp.]